MPIIITLGNQKGGVGKTTTTINLSDALGRNGLKVLTLDADPQGNCTSILIDKIELREKFSLFRALNDPFGKRTLSAMACHTHNNNVDIIANTSESMLWERNVGSGPDSVLGFSKLIFNDIKLSGYDFLLIDTPPNIGAMVNNALMISDFVIIPIPASDQFALDGLATFLRLMQKIKDHNQKLKLLGVLLTKYNPDEELHVNNRKRILAYFAEKGVHVFDTCIRMDVEIDLAHMKRKTLFEYDPVNHKAAEDHFNLAKEIIEIAQKKS